MTAPRCSVIVPTFGRPAFLAEALRSVAAQTMADLECIVVDDGTPEPLSLPFSDERFHVLRHPQNLGPAAARNSGLAAATGTYVAFLDDDDLWTERRLELGLERARPGVVAVCAGGRVGSDRVDVPIIVEPFGLTVMDRNPPHLGATAVLRSGCLPFDQRFRTCEDLDWWLRMSRTSGVSVDPEVGWLWRAHEGRRAGYGARERIEGSRQLLEEHAAFFESRPQALAYRWVRIGWLSRSLGDTSGARAAAWRAIRAHPAPRTLARAARLVSGR
jgi:glycosyltransferase involved in cell wall biosynthesis